MGKIQAEFNDHAEGWTDIDSDITFAPIGPRSRIATNPESLDAAKWEFEKDTENYIQELEKIVYPYQW